VSNAICPHFHLVPKLCFGTLVLKLCFAANSNQSFGIDWHIICCNCWWATRNVRVSESSAAVGGAIIDRRRKMDINKTQPNLRGLSLGSIVLALLGGAFYWWNPMGIIMSLAGLTVGAVDWVMARRQSLDNRLSILGIVLSALALGLCLAIAYLGWQAVTLTAP
jgi:hypothetical protein